MNVQRFRVGPDKGDCVKVNCDSVSSASKFVEFWVLFSASIIRSYLSVGGVCVRYVCVRICSLRQRLWVGACT